MNMMEISKKAAISARSQTSTDNMEEITARMQNGLRKTISMTFVKYVVIFFLPGIFVSVSTSTSFVVLEAPQTNTSRCS